MTKKLKTMWLWLSDLSWLERLWLLAPIAIWFSYLPKISLGSDATTNYELSITLIYLVALTVAGLPTIWRNKRKILTSKYVILITIFAFWSILTALWSVNFLRGLLTAGIIGLIYLIFLAAWLERARLRKILPKMISLLIVTSVVACLLAIAQMIIGTYIQSRNLTGLCAGCVASQFGFVRPNLFAIEPQFLGNLLLAPTLIIYHRLITKRRNWQNSLAFILLLTTLGLTLSRGAIYACGVGVIVIWLTVQRRWLNKLVTVDLIILAIVGCLGIQGGLAVLNPYVHETFWGAVTKSVNHLSLGIIDFRPEELKTNNDSPAPSTDWSINLQQPVYDGYVEESTDIRLNLSKIALAAWSSQDWPHKLFGTGLGSAGIVMARQTGNSYQKEIVQNEYVEILLERGLVGLVLFGLTIVATVYKLWQSRRIWAWSILAAYLVQWCFFSGLPNALHIYLIIIWLVLI